MARVIEDERNSLVDMAEIQLIKAVQEGNFKAVREVLRTLGKNRGYVERMEHSGNDGGPIRFIEAVRPNDSTGNNNDRSTDDNYSS